jgi:broad specificity phosphatase PhoE
MKLLLIRHAQSIDNEERRMQGQGTSPLSARGIEQAQRLAQRLIAEAWFPTHLYSSPLPRAAQTAAILRTQLLAAQPSSASIETIPIVQYADELQEFQNGILQGLTWTEAQAQYPDLCSALEASLDWLPIPNAETPSQGRDRARQFVQRVIQQHQNSDQIGVVTHEWLLNHLIAELLGCHHTWKITAGFTALFEFWLDLSRWQCEGQNQFNTELWKIHRFNDAQHLVLDRCNEASHDDQSRPHA